MLSKSNTKPFKCEQCHYSSKRSFDLRRHMQRHTKVKPIEGTEYKCSECSFTTKWKRNMGRHMHTHNKRSPVDEEEPCEEFLVELVEPSEAEWMEEDEDDTEDRSQDATSTEITMKLFVCAQCHYTSNRAFDLRRHEQTHTREKIVEGTAFECLKCQFKTKWKRNIERHVRLRHVEVSNECDAEELDEQSSEEFVVELMNTDDVYDQVCSDNSDSQPTTLKSTSPTPEYEIAEYPQPTSPAKSPVSNGEKRFKCAQCHYESKRAFDLRRHERRHAKVKVVDGTAVKCPECSFVTKWKRNMKRHMQQHKPRAVSSEQTIWEEKETLVELVEEELDSEVETYSLTIEPST
ncbi:hypothetical protein KR044_000564, partial [Drosophila immigrans]